MNQQAIKSLTFKTFKDGDVMMAKPIAPHAVNISGAMVVPGSRARKEWNDFEKENTFPIIGTSEIGLEISGAKLIFQWQYKSRNEWKSCWGNNPFEYEKKLLETRQVLIYNPTAIGSGLDLDKLDKQTDDFINNATAETYNNLLADSGKEVEDKKDGKVITLCGSTKFKDAFLYAQSELGKQGVLVFSVSQFSHADNINISESEKLQLSTNHFRMITISNEILVIDVNGYVGESTSKEIEHAKKWNKPIKYFSKEFPEFQNNLTPSLDEVAEMTSKLTAEDWLRENCKPHDWDRLSDNGPADFINTTDVIEYLQQYAKYRTQTPSEDVVMAVLEIVLDNYTFQNGPDKNNPDHLNNLKNFIMQKLKEGK